MKIDNSSAAMFPTGTYGAHNVTPEAFILMLQTRLDDLDSQIDLAMGRIQDRAATAKELSKKLEQLHGMKATADNNFLSNAKEKVTMDGKEMTAEAALLEMGFTKKDITFDTKNGQLGFKVKDIDKLIRKLEEELRGVNTGNELDMVGLQSTMQQRQQAVSLGTNLLKTLHEASESVIRNMI